HARVVYEQGEVVGGAAHRLQLVVLRDRAADDDARLAREAGQGGVEYLAADVVEVHVDPLRTPIAKRRGDVLGLVVDGGVEAQVLDYVAALVRAAGDPHRASPLELCDLADHAADGARGAGDDHGLALGWLPDVEQPEVGGHARHPQRADVHGQRGQVG